MDNTYVVKLARFSECLFQCSFGQFDIFSDNWYCIRTIFDLSFQIL